MSDSINFLLKFFLRQIAPFLFISVGIPCEFAMVTDVVNYKHLAATLRMAYSIEFYFSRFPPL